MNNPTNTTSELVSTVSRVLTPERGHLAEYVDSARTFLTRGADWLGDTELRFAACQLAYAARMGVAGRDFSDGKIVLALFDKACDALETLAVRSGEDATIAKKGIGQQIDVLKGVSGNFPEAGMFQAMPNNNLEPIVARLDRVVLK